jgi:hypothetical protein
MRDQKKRSTGLDVRGGVEYNCLALLHQAVFWLSWLVHAIPQLDDITHGYLQGFYFLKLRSTHAGGNVLPPMNLHGGAPTER